MSFFEIFMLLLIILIIFSPIVMLVLEELEILGKIKF